MGDAPWRVSSGDPTGVRPWFVTLGNSSLVFSTFPNPFRWPVRPRRLSGSVDAVWDGSQQAIMDQSGRLVDAV